MPSFNWNNLISFQNSQNDAFEELVCQLARREEIPNKAEFTKVGNPDGGVECYCDLANGDEYGWQAKYFLTAPGAVQWSQLEKSFKNALDKHPNLTKYYVAFPLDRQDPRINGQQWFMDKWREKTENWNAFAQTTYGKTIEFEYWGSSELLFRLTQEQNAGLIKFFFGELDLSDQWFEKQNQFAIDDLGPRYTPEINIALEIVENFDALSRNDEFCARIDEAYHKYMVSYRKVLEHLHIEHERFDALLQQLNTKIATLEQQYSAIVFNGNDAIKHEEIGAVLKEIEPISYEISELLDEINREEIKEKKITTSHGYRTATQYDGKIRDFREYLSHQYDFKELFASKLFGLANNPFMVLDGDAGIGKSHLLADVVKQRMTAGFNSVFLLGQHFREDKSPWSQILNELLELRCSKEEFLGALNAKAEAQGRRILIFIDAINEGKGRSFWSEFFTGFIEAIKQYEWLGLVLSIRSTYVDLIIPDDVFEKKLAIHVTHFGFDGVEYNASKIFFANYHIAQPSIPLLHPEFSNPLFLKLFCEGLQNQGLTHVPDGYEGITDIIQVFIGGIEKKLIKKYPNIKSLKLIDKVIQVLMGEMLDKQMIAYDAGCELVVAITSKYGINSELLDDLIAEGLLTKNISHYKQEYIETIYFAYERFEDHLKVKYLFEQFLERENPKESFEQNDLACYFDEQERYYYRGLIDAMSIQLPEIANVELLDMVSQDEIIINGFFNSLLWRKAESITPNVTERMLKNMGNENFQKNIFEVLFSTASNPRHPLNADFLHGYLSGFTMKDRDVFLISLLNSIYANGEANPIQRIIDWSWSEEPKHHISDDSVLLTSLALAWLLVSSNRQLRDYATKALISILQNRANVVLALLKKFEDMEEPYVYERLYAAAFGVVVRAEKRESLKELGEYIYHTIFDKEEVYPHILLRDYAKNAIEYINILGVDLDIDIEKVKPPYKSYLPAMSEWPSNADIEKFQDRDKNYHQSSIISSMVTEYGRGMGGYGDFGRYVFGSALRHFRLKEHEQRLSNYAVQKIFEEYGYDGEFFDAAEKAIQLFNDRYSRYNHKVERIGKKYQWIAFYDVMARVTDNTKMYVDSWGDSEEEMQYQGSFEPYVRDIDPTILLKSTSRDAKGPLADWCNPAFDIDWTMDHDRWIQEIDDLPNPLDSIFLVDDDGEEWISLYTFPRWKEPVQKGYDSSNVTRKEVWYILKAYLIPDQELDEFMQWAEKQDFWNDWMPSGQGHYEMFNRENYWSDAYKFLQGAYYGDTDWADINSYRGADYPHKIGLTSNEYYWEEEFDYSKEESLRFLKPSMILFDGLKLQYAPQEGEFIDGDNKLVCFDAKMKYSSFDSLLCNKEKLAEYLREHNLSLCWTIVGEKQIFVPMGNREEVGLMQLNGYCFMKVNMETNGKMHVVSMDKNHNESRRDVELDEDFGARQNDAVV